MLAASLAGGNLGYAMRFLCVVGTRPEAIKLAPLILELRRHAETITVCSGQHTELALAPLSWFGITPDDRIDLDTEGRTLAGLTGALFTPMERMLAKHRPDVVLAQGDTTTVLVTALTAFYLGIPFAHVEAGLRTGDLAAPFPEEFNRVATGRLAKWHFCPTERAVANLRAEGAHPASLYMTGNTGIDALRLTLEKVKPNTGSGSKLRRILLTAHRRENHGQRLKEICRAVRAIVDEFADVEFIVPVHPNPAVGSSIQNELKGCPRVQLLPPLSYPHLVEEMAKAFLILTDSGGIQEEAPFLKKPVLVLREVTERPEVVEMGLALLVGTDASKLVVAVRRLLTDVATHARMAGGGSPYGDGYASPRIAAAFGLVNAPKARAG
jgi:UDP-N-acetylglucosamine 2-epimerase (non-hydrolysing)